MPDDALLRHLRHAEEWLGRARRDYRRGDPRSAVLRLMLAEAEVRRAREIGTRSAATQSAPRAWRGAAALAAGAGVVAAAACAAFLAGVRLAPAGPPAARVGPPASIPYDVIRLDAGGLLAVPPGAPRAGSGARTFGDRVVEDVAVRTRWLAPAAGGAVTLVTPKDAQRPVGSF